MRSEAALIGTRVRVDESGWRSEWHGLMGTISARWGDPGYLALDVLLEGGGLRSPTPEEDGDGGGPAPTRKATPTPDPPTSHDPSVAFFNTLGSSGKLDFRFTEF